MSKQREVLMSGPTHKADSPLKPLLAASMRVTSGRMVYARKPARVLWSRPAFPLRSKRSSRHKRSNASSETWPEDQKKYQHEQKKCEVLTTQSTRTIEVHVVQFKRLELVEGREIDEVSSDLVAAELERFERRGARHEHRKNVVKLPSCAQ